MGGQDIRRRLEKQNPQSKRTTRARERLSLGHNSITIKLIGSMVRNWGISGENVIRLSVNGFVSPTGVSGA